MLGENSTISSHVFSPNMNYLLFVSSHSSSAKLLLRSLSIGEEMMVWRSYRLKVVRSDLVKPEFFIVGFNKEREGNHCGSEKGWQREGSWGSRVDAKSDFWQAFGNC